MITKPWHATGNEVYFGDSFNGQVSTESFALRLANSHNEAMAAERDHAVRLVEAAARRFPDNPLVVSILMALAEEIRGF